MTIKSNVIFSMFLIALISCNSTPQETKETELPALTQGPKVLKSSVSGYEMYAGKSVTRVQSILTNTGETTLVNYIVAITKNEQQYNDTVLVELPARDTVKTEIIFTEVPFDEDQPLTVTHELQLLNH